MILILALFVTIYPHLSFFLPFLVLLYPHKSCPTLFSYEKTQEMVLFQSFSCVFLCTFPQITDDFGVFLCIFPQITEDFGVFSTIKFSSIT
jgi:hypothetical protein